MLTRWVVLLCVAWSWPAGWAQDPLFRRINTATGLPSNTVYGAVQDQQGFLWFGTDAGAIRYDGLHLDRFDVSKGLSDEEVFVVSVDSRGRVWFLTGNGRPSYFDGSRIHSPANDSSLARIWLRTGIRSMIEDGNGAIWFGGLKGEVAVLEPSGKVRELVVEVATHGMHGGHVTIARGPNGDALVFNNLTPLGAKRIEQSRIESPRGASHMVQAHADGSVIHTEPAFVRQWNGKAWEVLLDTLMLPGYGGFHHAYPLAPDELWVTLWSGGVLWLKRESGRWVPVRERLFKDDLVNNVMRDREGNLWVSTDHGGVIMFTARGSRTAFYRGERGREEEFLRLHADRRLGVWCGTNQGDLYRLGQRLELIDLPPKGPQFVRVSAIRSQGDALWTATYANVYRSHMTSSGIVHVDVPTENTYQPSLVASSGMKSLTTGRDGRVVGTMYGAFLYDSVFNGFRQIDRERIPGIRMYAPHLDERGTLWFEDQQVLCAWDSSGLRRLETLGLQEGLRITDITSVNDTLFVATNGEGVLVVVEGRELTRIDAGIGLPSDHVHHLFFDKRELFVATEKGAVRVEGPWTTPRSRHYDTGLMGATNQVRDVAADSAHTYVLFADGLCRLPRHSMLESAGVPVPYFRSWLRNDTLLALKRELMVLRGRDRLLVELGAVHFDVPEQVQLEYRLGPEDEWMRAKGRWLDLSNTPGGVHEFQMRASLEGGTWSSPLEMTLHMVPPIWERHWAIALMALLTGVLAYILLRILLVRRFRMREADMRQREQLARERHRIAMDLHDDLGAELSSLLLMTRMEREHPDAGSLARVEQVVGTLTDKVKEVIWSTDPKLDTLEATLTFIQRHVLQRCARHGLQVRTSLPPELPALELSAHARRELYLISKEALNNVLKHGHASRFIMAALLRDDVLHLTFTDDGRGGVVALGDGLGHGLRNMAARAAALGGSLTLSEGRPHGTRVHLQLPLTPFGMTREALRTDRV